MNSKHNNRGRLVYSTSRGRLCPHCQQPSETCACSEKTPSPPPKGTPIRVGRETKGRKGKGVTIITGLALGKDELKKMAKQLKQKCGAGGSIKGNVIEIQGDHRDKLVEELIKMGYPAKRSGG